MVMPRSRSSSLESMTRSTWASLARKVPLWLSMASTRVVLPWSTWAMMAMLRMLEVKELVFLKEGYFHFTTSGDAETAAADLAGADFEKGKSFPTRRVLSGIGQSASDGSESRI